MCGALLGTVVMVTVMVMVTHIMWRTSRSLDGVGRDPSIHTLLRFWVTGLSVGLRLEGDKCAGKNNAL